MVDFDFDFDLAPDAEAKKDHPLEQLSSRSTGASPEYKPLSADMPDNELPAYISRLNGPQREAALAVDGPLIVLAGAGSGKTRMLTSRMAYLIGHCGVPAYRILAVTFTNKAAREMKERVEKSLHENGPSEFGYGQPEIGTFHSVCVRILRRHREFTPFTKPFVIYDDSDQLSLIKTVMKKLHLDPKRINPKSIQGSINRAKCDALDPHEIDPEDWSQYEKHFKNIYEVYQKDLFEANALDFGEILTLTYKILRDNGKVRQYYQRRYQYVHVDEYQDTNRAQYLILSLLAGKEGGGHENICVVGDEDQSIYSWRGADIRNILDFEKDFGDAKVVKLEQNYRSTKTIITAASHVIGNNTQRKAKELWTDNDDGTPVSVLKVPDERTEAEFVIAEIKRLAREDGKAFDDFAIFYRTHAQSRQFEDVLRRENVQYQIVGGLRFYDRKEIKDILAYFKVIMNPNDSVSLKRIINVPARGIGKTTLDKLEAMAANPDPQMELDSGEPVGVWAVLNQVVAGRTSITKRTAGKLASFVDMMRKMIDKQPTLLLSELYHILLDETGYVNTLKQEGSVESLARIENLEEFDNILQEFEEQVFKAVPEDQHDRMKPRLMEAFLEQTALVNQADEGVDISSVKLMSLHAAKGLEFPVVFMSGMEEGIFPSIRQWEEIDPDDLEEERRLCYVGMTRAEERLYMLHASVRRVWGNFNYQEPARFLDEIPEEMANTVDLTREGRSTGGSNRGLTQRSYSTSGAGSLGFKDGYSSVKGGNSYSSRGSFAMAAAAEDEEFIGRRLIHPTYGEGRVVATDGSGPNQKVTVEFKSKVKKKFVLRFLSSCFVE